MKKVRVGWSLRKDWMMKGKRYSNERIIYALNTTAAISRLIHVTLSVTAVAGDHFMPLAIRSAIQAKNMVPLTHSV